MTDQTTNNSTVIVEEKRPNIIKRAYSKVRSHPRTTAAVLGVAGGLGAAYAIGAAVNRADNSATADTVEAEVADVTDYPVED